jgi:hypothetical protein
MVDSPKAELFALWIVPSNSHSNPSPEKDHVAANIIFVMLKSDAPHTFMYKNEAFSLKWL